MAADVVDPVSWPALVQAGGVVVFAFAVWREQRDLRKTMQEMRDALVALVTQTNERKKRHRTATPLGLPVDGREDDNG